MTELLFFSLVTVAVLEILAFYFLQLCWLRLKLIPLRDFAAFVFANSFKKRFVKDTEVL